MKDSDTTMTMRDEFAKAAMQSLMLMERASEIVDEETGLGDGDTLFIHTKWLSIEAYMIADAMLKARSE